MADSQTEARKRSGLAVLLIMLVSLLPLVVQHGYVLRILIMISYFAVASYGWDVIGGYAGQLSLGQAAFFSIGAYAAASAYLIWKLSPAVGALAGVGLAALLALGLGSLVLRLRGPYFTLSTLAAAEVVRILLLHFKSITGGAEGRVIPYTGFNLSALQFATDRPYYYIAVALLALAIWTSYQVSRSRLGFQLAAIRNDEDAAESVGINLMSAKVKAFVISACLTALAGAFYVIYDRYIDPYSTCSSEVSVKILLIALVGGRRSIWGPLLGAVLLIPLTELTNAYFASIRAGASMVVYSIILIIVVLYAPDGLIRVLRRRPSRGAVTLQPGPKGRNSHASA
ncbi:MAG: branched-chain amino acid ABC transporter permease [Bacillota bacterium]|nr:branched-chain amino acid ABC transporter permease [Bacillota bacterium]